MFSDNTIFRGNKTRDPVSRCTWVGSVGLRNRSVGLRTT